MCLTHKRILTWGMFFGKSHNCTKSFWPFQSMWQIYNYSFRLCNDNLSIFRVLIWKTTVSAQGAPPSLILLFGLHIFSQVDIIAKSLRQEKHCCLRYNQWTYRCDCFCLVFGWNSLEISKSIVYNKGTLLLRRIATWHSTKENPTSSFVTAPL